MDSGYVPEKESKMTNGNISPVGTATNCSQWIDKLQKRDKALLDKEVREIFSSTIIDVEIARKRVSMNPYSQDIEMKDMISDRKLEELKHFNEREATLINNCTNYGESNKDYGLENENNNLLINQTSDFSSAGDGTDERSNFVNSDTVPVITIDLSNSPRNVDERIHQTIEELKVDSSTPSSSRCSTPRLVKRSRSFNDIKNYFEAKMCVKDRKETLPATQSKKITETTPNGHFESTFTPLISHKNRSNDDSIETSDSSSEDGSDQIPVAKDENKERKQQLESSESAIQDSDRESEDIGSEDDDSSSSSDENLDEDESDSETTSDVAVDEYIERLMQEDRSSSDATSDQSCSSDAVLKRTTAKVLKRIKQKYKLARRSNSESEESSSEEAESGGYNTVFGQNERTRVRKNDSNVFSSEENEEEGEIDSSSSVSSSDHSDDDPIETSDSSGEDSLDFTSNLELQEKTLLQQKTSPKLELLGDSLSPYQENGHGSLSESDESIIYQSYDFEEQSGKAIFYHDEIGHSEKNKASSWKDTRSSSLPNFIDRNKLVKQVSFEEDPEVITVQDDPQPEIPTTLEERFVSDLRWPFTNFYVKEVQEDTEDTSLAVAKLRSEVFPCYKSRKFSSSFPGRKKDVMLGRVWWVEWWAENECTEEDEPKLTSARNKETS